MKGIEEIIKQFRIENIKKCNELTRIENEAREQTIGVSLTKSKTIEETLKSGEKI